MDEVEFPRLKDRIDFFYGFLLFNYFRLFELSSVQLVFEEVSILFLDFNNKLRIFLLFDLLRFLDLFKIGNICNIFFELLLLILQRVWNSLTIFSENGSNDMAKTAFHQRINDSQIYLVNGFLDFIGLLLIFKLFDFAAFLFPYSFLIFEE